MKKYKAGYFPSKDVFLDNVKKTKGCWNWENIARIDGYGRIWANKSYYIAHRVSWILHNGEIPEGMLILHKCDNRSCVNPKHLYIGDNFDNARDKKERGRNPHHRLTISQVKKIREFFIHQMPIRKIAEIYNMSSGNIWRIIRRKIWAHIS